MADDGADVLTRTEVARATRTSNRGLRRWLRRRPIRRTLVLLHRWTALVLGVFLLAETTSGAIVLYQTEYFRATHASLYRHTASAHPITAQDAYRLVTEAHPDFSAAWVSDDAGIYVVGDTAYASVYGVDPGTAHITGRARLNDGLMGFLVNLHDCGLGCPGYPGYVPVLAATMSGLGIGVLHDTTWGGFALTVLGLLMVVLAISGVVTWWPGLRRLSHGFRVRTRRGRFARDYDLHNVIGMVAVPFLFMWGLTGAAIYVPAVENAWLAITGGHAVDENRYVFVPHKAEKGAPEIGIDAATAVALRHHPGRVAYLTTPTKLTPGYYSVSIVGRHGPYRYRGFYGGDVTVFVDSHDPAHVRVVDTHGQPPANTFYEKVFEPAHFGWLVNPWWRVIWFVLGLSPLALALTGLSTWLFRRGSKRRRRSLRAAALSR